MCLIKANERKFPPLGDDPSDENLSDISKESDSFTVTLPSFVALKLGWKKTQKQLPLAQEFLRQQAIFFGGGFMDVRFFLGGGGGEKKNYLCAAGFSSGTRIQYDMIWHMTLAPNCSTQNSSAFR